MVSSHDSSVFGGRPWRIKEDRHDDRHENPSAERERGSPNRDGSVEALMNHLSNALRITRTLNSEFLPWIFRGHWHNRDLRILSLRSHPAQSSCALLTFRVSSGVMTAIYPQTTPWIWLRSWPELKRITKKQAGRPSTQVRYPKIQIHLRFPKKPSALQKGADPRHDRQNGAAHRNIPLGIYIDISISSSMGSKLLTIGTPNDLCLYNKNLHATKSCHFQIEANQSWLKGT